MAKYTPEEILNRVKSPGDISNNGWTKKAHDTIEGPKPPIDGIAVSSNPVEYADDNSFNAVEEKEFNPDGTNPSYTLPPFADGKDLRNKG